MYKSKLKDIWIKNGWIRKKISKKKTKSLYKVFYVMENMWSKKNYLFPKKYVIKFMEDSLYGFVCSIHDKLSTFTSISACSGSIWSHITTNEISSENVGSLHMGQCSFKPPLLAWPVNLCSSRVVHGQQKQCPQEKTAHFCKKKNQSKKAWKLSELVNDLFSSSIMTFNDSDEELYAGQNISDDLYLRHTPCIVSPFCVAPAVSFYHDLLSSWGLEG